MIIVNYLEQLKPLTKRQDCLKGECPIKFMLLNNRFNKKGNIKNIDDINKIYMAIYNLFKII